MKRKIYNYFKMKTFLTEQKYKKRTTKFDFITISKGKGSDIKIYNFLYDVVCK